MWFLEHESLFGGKRIWLRPGSQQFFGRTSKSSTKAGDKSSERDGAEGKQWRIDNKAVSRQHFQIELHASGGGTELHARSKLIVTDLSCRQGTTIQCTTSDDTRVLKSKKAEDGTLEYDTATLTGTEYTVRLAHGYAPFKVVWRPTVFTHAARESKESKARSAQLHALDIKTTTDFLFDKTTHVVSQKRNLPKVLSGLVTGKHIVSGAFLDAVLEVATNSVDEAGNYVPSKLEEDFDEWWPKEKDYIPPAGAEPLPRPPWMLEPDPSRAEVFSGLTFIFMDENQHNSLLEPITGGGGKGLYYEVKPGETTAQDYVDYVHSVAGKKKRSRTSGDQLPIVTVRLAAYPDGMEAWAAAFVIDVDQALNQRSVLQNEFLDAIISKDRSSLQRPPAEVVNKPSSAREPTPAPTPAQRSMREPTPMSQPKAPSPAKSASPVEEVPKKSIPRKRALRPKTESRFAGFDDYEPPPKRSKVEDAPLEKEQQYVQQTVSLSVAASQPRTAQPTQTPRSLVHQTVEKEEQLDSLFPGAAKIRQQRAATRAPSASVEPEEATPAKKQLGKGKEALERLRRSQAKLEGKEINIREHTRIRVKEEEDRRKADEDSLREALAGVDISEMRNLAQIEDMELRSDKAAGRQSQVNGDRWDADWNGRRNFKKFRRRGVERGVQMRKVLVTLEEAAPKKGFGVGDAFFIEDVEPSATSRSRESRRKQADDSSEEGPGFVRRRRGQPSEVIDVEDSGPDDEDVLEERTQKSSGITQRVVETQVDNTQTQTQTQRGKKRGATVVAEQPARKKGKIARPVDDSDEEETGFRFKRRS
jgi:hypothetical protein